MPFVPHTKEECDAMLKTLGLDSIEQLFDEIPEGLRCGELKGIPEATTEMALGRELAALARRDGVDMSFLGAGSYAHHIPAAVWEVTRRGEFYTAYTPYQAEASQGTLQLLYEYQSMMVALTAMDVSNASLYDGASALAEAVLMAVRVNRKVKARRIAIPRSVHPHYRAAVQAIVAAQDIELVELPFCQHTGRCLPEHLEALQDTALTALVIPQPNFFGHLEDVDQLTTWAQQKNALVIGVVNPTALALLKPPGLWGDTGADIVCGEGQPLGIPIASGGPYFGFMCCKKAYVRQLPGRVIGKTCDEDGQRGYALTLQAREQHIRRSKATSNICTNQGLMVTAATIYMSLLSAKGLRTVAAQSHRNTRHLRESLSQIAEVRVAFDSAYFHETVLQLPTAVPPVLDELAARGILGGYALQAHYPELDNGLLVCATEVVTDQDTATFAQQLSDILKKS